MGRWLANTPLKPEQKASLCYLLTFCSSEFVEFLNRLFTPPLAILGPFIWAWGRDSCPIRPYHGRATGDVTGRSRALQWEKGARALGSSEAEVFPSVSEAPRSGRANRRWLGLVRGPKVGSRARRPSLGLTGLRGEAEGDFLAFLTYYYYFVKRGEWGSFALGIRVMIPYNYHTCSH